MGESVGARLGTSRTQDLVLLAALGVGAYVVYQVFKQLKGLEAGIGQAATLTYQGAQTLTAPVASALASAWNSMQPAGMAAGLQGNVIFPDGSQVPLSQLTVKQDALGNVYVAAPQTGLLLQLQPSNAQGNWPAIQITDPSQIGQAPSSGNAVAQPPQPPLPVDFGLQAGATQGWGP